MKKHILSMVALSAIISMGVANGLAAEKQKKKQDGMPPWMQKKEIKTTIYQNVTLIDGIQDKVQKNMSVIVIDDKISAVLPTSDLTSQQTEKVEVVDGSKWYALPGLVESHTHVATQPNRQYAEFILNRQLYGGITTARDLAGDARALADLSRASLVKEIPAPDLKFVALMAGPSFFSDPRTISSGLGEVPGKVSWMQAVTSETDMKTAVAYARGTWASAIKTYAAIDGKTMKMISSEARRQGIPIWSHVHVGPARAHEVAAAGVHSMSHVCDLSSAVITDEMLEKAARGELSGRVEVDLSSPKIDAVFEEMKKHNTVLDATLRVSFEIDKNKDMMRKEREKMAKELAKNPNAKKKSDIRRRGIRAKCGLQDAYDLTSRAYKSGVRISTGTDGWTSPKDVYPALYDEFKLMNMHVGMSMMDVIKAATINGAYSIGLEKEIGTIEAGKYANLVFLTENPLEGADSFKSVELTVKRGTPYYRKNFVLGSPGEGFEEE